MIVEQIGIKPNIMTLDFVKKALILVHSVCGKPWERVSPILVTLTSRSDSNFERSNISLKENKWDGVDLNSNGLDKCVIKNEGKILWFSADSMRGNLSSIVGWGAFWPPHPIENLLPI